MTTPTDRCAICEECGLVATAEAADVAVGNNKDRLFEWKDILWLALMSIIILQTCTDNVKVSVVTLDGEQVEEQNK